MDERTGNRRPATGNRQSSMRLGRDIAERLLNFAVAAVRLAAQLPRDPAGRHLSSQLVRSATGGGANHEEARAAESREDFIHKVGGQGSSRERLLAFIKRSAWTRQDLPPAIREAGELAATLGASARTARAHR